MFSHLFISVTDFDTAFDFYRALMNELRLELQISVDSAIPREIKATAGSWSDN